MGATQFRKCQVGLQTAHGTAVAPTIQLPLNGEYTNEVEQHVAPYDAGTWTPITQVQTAVQFAKVKFKGTSFYETLPVFLNSGFGDVEGATLTHTWPVSPVAVGVPKPLTGMFGAVSMNIGVTGPAVKIKDLYLDTLTLSGNLNTKVVDLEADMFGAQVDDGAAHAGYAFIAVNLIPTMDAMITPMGGLQYEDVTTTGGIFLTMTAFTGALLDWKLVIKTGNKPLWTGDQGAILFSGIMQQQPSLEFTPTIRTNSTTYAAVMAKHMDITYQELMLTLTGSAVPSARSTVLKMTGRWSKCPTAHADGQGEVVMQPTFTCETPHLQITTPHWLTITNVSTHGWT